MTSVANKFMDVDPHLINAFSSRESAQVHDEFEFDKLSAVKFDMSHKSGASSVLKLGRKGGLKEDEEVTAKKCPLQGWELDVRSLISSRKWLQNYGLKKNRLELHQLLPAIGFKLCNEFDTSLKKPISSRYGGGLFRQLNRPDGKTFNINCTKDKLYQLEKRLIQAMQLFKRRLEWLTTESRRLFGVIEEKSVTIVLDIRSMSPQQFDQYRTALQRIIREQVSMLSKFNLIRACEDMQLYNSECVPVSHDTIENAVQWLWNLDRLATVSNTAAAEAILKASHDQHNEAIYLFSEGTSIDSGKEILKEKISYLKLKFPIHVISFNCDCSNTIKFLKDFAKSTKGKFHAYAVVMELDAYEAQSGESSSRGANIMLKRKTFGGIPPGAGVREDVVLIFEEMEEARNNLAQIRMLIERAPEPNGAKAVNEIDSNKLLSTKDEQYMTSLEWLEVYGLEVRKLGLYDVLSGVAFKHLDGVINVMEKPDNENQTDAISHQKLVHARYCERFPVVRWKDGRVVHVQVTPDVHRGYEERVQVALNKIQQRIDWLNKGSRALFGTVVEDQIYILIDTSASMQQSLAFVKKKIFVLMQEQLRHKRKFNFVTFNSKAAGWKDRLVEVSERSLQSAWSWIQNLSCWGSTNTYGALQLAMSDPQTQAIYLLTDGRPDQPPKSIIAQVQMQKSIPIHTISFNCEDSSANEFLYNLSEATGGRYHYYCEEGQTVDQPEAWESMDIKLLRDEIKRGLENLDKLAGLRDECTSLAWKRETEELRRSMNSEIDYNENARKSESRDRSRPNASSRPTSAPSRPSSAPSQSPRSNAGSRFLPCPPAVSQTGPTHSTKSIMHRPRSAKASLSRKPLVAGHTKTSLMRTLNSSGRFSPNEWLLPETKKLFELQSERQKGLAKRGEQQEQIRNKKKKILVKSNEMSSKQWLTKHGLAAKRLTIIDVLGSTFIPHKAKYVSILDKHVVSKVFDNILPIAHVSRNQQVNLVNPNGVNLKEFERKLRVSVETYKKRLNTLVWNAFPSASKEEFDSDTRAPFIENKQKYLQLLEDAEWPVKEYDIILLVKEICRGEKILKQSQTLRRTAAGEDVDDDDDHVDGDDNDDNDDNETARSKKSNLSQESGKNGSHVGTKMEEMNNDDDNASVASERSEKSQRSERSEKSQRSGLLSQRSNGSPPRSETSPRPTSVKDDDNNHEGLGQVSKVPDKKTKGKVKESTEVMKSKIRVKLDTLKGHKVIARLDEDGLYYPAVVLKCPDPRHAKISYDSGSNAQVLTRNIILTGGAVARPQLQVGDYVMMRVVNLDTNDECYVPAIIQTGPQKMEVQAKFYSVIMYNGQKASTLRTFLVKISKERFELASMYIAHQQNEDREEADNIVHVTPRHPKERKSKKEVENFSKSSHKRSRKKEKRLKKEIFRSPSPQESRHTSIREERIEEEIESNASSRNSSSRGNSDIEEDMEQDERETYERETYEKETYERETYETETYDRETNERETNETETSRSVVSIDGRRGELERMLNEIKVREAKQEHQKQKLKRKEKKLAKREQRLEDRKYISDENMEILVMPTPDMSGDEGEKSSKDDLNQPSSLLHLRKSLPRLRPGEEVLAKWSDDGWYYRGIVKFDHEDYSYNLEDSAGLVERIWREDIISENDSYNQVFETDGKVIALHPDYSFSYAPGTVMNVTETSIEIEFYDRKMSTLPRNEVYHSPTPKYDMDVTYIHKQESRLIGAAVVARDDRTGAFYPGSVIRRADNGVDYAIGWTDGTEVDQKSVYIFSAFTRRPHLSAGDRVLALADPIQVKFLPGYLMGSSEENLIVKFCDGEISETVDPATCYWLGKTYYEDVVEYHRIHDSSFY